MKNLQKIVMTLALVFGMGLLFVPATVSADTSAIPSSICTGNSDSTLCQHKDDNLMTYVTRIINTMMFVLGALSVIMIIVGGVRYTISMGDSKNIETAKNTIMYAIIGLVVAILAAAIVNFVVARLNG